MNPAPPSNRRILVIDDNPSIHADFRKILTTPVAADAAFSKVAADLFGEAAASPARTVFELTSCYQGQEGFEAVRNAVQRGTPFAAAFVDVRMPPGWDGLETIARIWEVDADIQLVICTAYSDYSSEDIARRLGASDRLVILKKPFDVMEVAQLASALTEKWSALQAARARLRELEAANEELRRALGQRPATAASTPLTGN